MALGSFFGGLLIRMGRRKTILIYNIAGIISIGISLFLSVPAIILGKLAYGFCGAVLNTASPKFLDETVPQDLLSKYGISTNIFVCLGIGAGMFIGAGLPPSDDFEAMESDNFWRVVYGLPILFQLPMFLIFLLVIKTDSVIFNI